MADTEDKDANADGNLRIDIATLFSELRIALESLAAGIEMLLPKPEAAPVKDALGILAQLARQGLEAIAALDAALEGVLLPRA